MTTAAQAAGERAVGVFPVTVDARAVAEFAAALGRDAAADAETPVPLTFPLRWFSEPTIRAALFKASLPARAEGPATLPVHIEQRIALSEPLRVGATYGLALSVTGPDARGVLRVNATVSDAHGRGIGSLASGFLLVSAAGVGAATPGRR